MFDDVDRHAGVAHQHGVVSTDHVRRVATGAELQSRRAVRFDVDRRAGWVEVVAADRGVDDETKWFAAVAGVRHAERKPRAGRAARNRHRRCVLVDHDRIEHFVDCDGHGVARDARLRNACDVERHLRGAVDARAGRRAERGGRCAPRTSISATLERSSASIRRRETGATELHVLPQAYP